MILSFSPFQSSRPGWPAVPQVRRAAIYSHPSDVTSDPKLTTAEKRPILASWISDARAVENAPSLRRLESGAVVEVDAIMQRAMLTRRKHTLHGRSSWVAAKARGRGSFAPRSTLPRCWPLAMSASEPERF